MTNPTVLLRPHQQDATSAIRAAIEAGVGQAVGRIVAPTGSGKTFIEASALLYQMQHNSVSRIHLVLAPRIVLCNQLLAEYRKFCGNRAFRAMAFHSGTVDGDDTTAWKESNTTSVSEIVIVHDNAIKGNQDLVVFGTYHSCHKLQGIEFDTLIADESQYCVSENFNDAIRSLTANVRLFFTATERHTASNKGRGLNNEEVYGKLLYTIPPSELIRLGMIVPPRLHIMHAVTEDERLTVVDEIVQLAVAQDGLTRPVAGMSKILFAMKGTEDVQTVCDNLPRLRAALPDHDIFTITSKGGARINGVEVRRNQFLKELKTRTNCLIFHYDILSEGIDVDGITGVCIMRNMVLSKLLQTIGRAIRILKSAPHLKQWAWVSVAALNGNEDDKARVVQYVNAIRDGGFDLIETAVETGTPHHVPDADPMEDAYEDDARSHRSLFLTSVEHDVEEAANVTAEAAAKQRRADAMAKETTVDGALNAFFELLDADESSN